jgi:DNA replication protein DnaC
MAICELCGDVGLVRGENRMSRPCVCQAEKAIRFRVNRAGIPREYSQATLQNFQRRPNTAGAWTLARRFVEEFIPGKPDSCGLLLWGSTGTGKTHMAAGMLRQLAEEKGVEGRFAEMRELLDRLRSSYGNDARESEGEILKPLFAADLVVIDDLGATRPTDWAFEMVEIVIGGLYNRQVSTIVTTNLPNLGPGAAAGNGYERAARTETLGDRIGARMFSRLQAMCMGVEMNGADWRLRK